MEVLKSSYDHCTEATGSHRTEKSVLSLYEIMAVGIHGKNSYDIRMETTSKGIHATGKISYEIRMKITSKGIHATGEILYDIRTEMSSTPEEVRTVVVWRLEEINTTSVQMKIRQEVGVCTKVLGGICTAIQIRR